MKIIDTSQSLPKLPSKSERMKETESGKKIVAAAADIEIVNNGEDLGFAVAKQEAKVDVKA